MERNAEEAAPAWAVGEGRDTKAAEGGVKGVYWFVSAFRALFAFSFMFVVAR